MRDQLAFTVSVILLALLFVFVAVLAGLLFTFGPPEFVRVKPPRGGGEVYSSSTGRVDLALAADGSDVLREESFTSSVPAGVETDLETIPEGGILMGGGMGGELPMLCPQKGPQIRGQKYYPSPVLHDAVVEANTVTFHLGTGEQGSSTENREEAP